MIKRVCVLAALAASTAYVQAQAQTTPRIVSPNRADQNAPGEGVRTAPRLSAPSLPHARNPDEPIRPFTLTQVDVSGSSLSQAELDRAYAPFMGQTIDNAALAKLTDAVAAAYGGHDFALYTVFVPTQSFAGGDLKLLVIEGHIQSAHVTGKGLSNHQKDLLRRYIARLQRERPLHTSTLQRYVSLIRDIPGLYPDLSLKAGTEEGGVDLTVEVKPQFAQAAAGVSNRGTALLGQTQLQSDLFLNGLVIGGDQLRGTVVLPTEPRLFQYYSATYSAPLNDLGTTVQVNAGYLRTRPTTIPLQGDAVSVGVQITHPVIRSYNRNLYVTAGIDGVNSDSALFGQNLSHDHIRTGRLAASFTQQFSDIDTLTINGSASRGLNIFGEYVVSPDFSKPDFTKFNAKIIDNLKLGKSFVLRLDGYGQWTHDPLTGSEQVALGGDEFGRAYEAAVVTGDSGVAGSAELAFQPQILPMPIAGSEAYGFVDGGRVWTRERAGYAGFSSDIASVGGGVRMRVVQRSLVQLELARGLTDPVVYEDRRAWRLLFAVKTLF